jgi:lipopolysaccharide export LptBFGC system permease protein LptF
MVMRACGISLYRVATPMIILALVVSGVLFVLDDRVVGESTRKAETLNAGNPQDRSATLQYRDAQLARGRDGRIYHYQAYEAPNAFNGRRPTLYGVSMYEAADASIPPHAAHVRGAGAIYASTSWQARDGWTQTFGTAGAPRGIPRKGSADAAGGRLPRARKVDSSRMNFGELREYVRRLGSSGVNVAEQEVQLHRKLAFPAGNAGTDAALAIPFGVTTGKKGALYGIGLAMVLAARTSC